MKDYFSSRDTYYEGYKCAINSVLLILEEAREEGTTDLREIKARVEQLK